MDAPTLSVVAPVHDEVTVVAELVRRIRAAIGASGQIVIVDDASTDGTAEVLAGLPDVHVVTLGDNLGQFRATCAGLSATTGEQIVVLDGDLQDPPELIGELVAALGDGDVAFAVKTSRVDPSWFRVGRWGYRLLARLGRGVPPSGAGSYCVMSRKLAMQIAESPLRSANLSAVIVSLAEGRATWRTVDYAKAERYDGRSRVGPVGLVKEALGSLRATGALSRLMGVAVVAVVAALLWAFGP